MGLDLNDALQSAADANLTATSMGTPEEALSKLGYTRKHRSAAELPVLSMAQLLASPLEREWLIKNLLAPRELSLMYGEPGAGKSFFVLDIALHLATGRAWQGLKVGRKTPVLYICAEGLNGLQGRVRAWLNHQNVDPETCALFAIPEPVTLGPQESRIDALIDAARKTSAALVIVDTLARCMLGDENTSEDMGLLIRDCDRLRRETGGHVMLVHHKGKDHSRGARGHSSLLAAVDLAISIEGRSGVREALVVKAKDGPSGQTHIFKLTPHLLGRDRDGDDITSCAVEFVETGKGDRPSRPRGISAKCLLALQKLAQDPTKQNASAPDENVRRSIPPGSIAVKATAWKAACVGAGIGGESDASRKAAFQRCKASMLQNGIIGEADGWVWSIGHA